MKILSHHHSKECITTKQFKGSCPFPISMMVSTGEIYENLRVGTEVGNWIKKCPEMRHEQKEENISEHSGWYPEKIE